MLFCETKPSIGLVQGSQVTYPDAFSDGVHADVRFVYKIGSFSRDIILRAQLPDPALYGMNPATVRLWNLSDLPLRRSQAWRKGLHSRISQQGFCAP